MNDASPACLLSLPNETLINIFSRYSHFDFVKYTSDGQNYQLSQILVLRQVCRRFRFLVAELPLWRDKDFLFGSLIKLPALSNNSSSFREKHKMEMEFMKVLFNDAYLVDNLCGKTDWTFDSVDGLSLVTGSIPGFEGNVSSIYLKLWNNEGTRFCMIQLIY
jgi:F-box domain